MGNWNPKAAGAAGIVSETILNNIAFGEGADAVKKTVLKILTIAVCAAVLVTVTIGETLALVSGTTEPLVNTFVIGEDILAPGDEFILKEHKAADDDSDGEYTLDTSVETAKNEYDVMPGVDLAKDPFVRTDMPLQADAYVFIEVVDGTGSSLSFAVDTGSWTLMSGVTGKHGGAVYRLAANGGMVGSGSKLAQTYILEDNVVHVAAQTVTDPGTLNFYGYMIQAQGFSSAAAAWSAV